MVDEIRVLRQDEMDLSLDLSSFAFQYDLSQEDRNERKTYSKPNTIWGYFVNGQLAAKMTIHPMHTYVNGRTFAMGGVASVATWPEFRRKGMVAQLLKNALQVMKEQGQSLSFLHPFAIPFYRKFGWELYTDYVEYELQADKLPTGVQPSGYVERVERDAERLQPIYAAYAKKYNGMLARDENWWKQSVFKRHPGQAAVYKNADHTAKGYLLYEVKERQLKVGEFVALDMDAWHGLWKFIANHDSMFEKITLRAPADDPLSFLLFNPRVKQAAEPYFMARIVDVQAFLAQFPFAEGEVGSFRLHVEDEQAEWNQGCFAVEIDAAGRASVTKLESDGTVGGGSGSSGSEVRCRIQTLTAMLMGYKRPADLHRYGLLTAEESLVAQLERHLPRQSTFLADYF